MALGWCLVCGYLVSKTYAAAASVLEPEEGLLAAPAEIGADPNAGFGKYVQFGSNPELEPAGLFITRAQLERAKTRATSNPPFSTESQLLRSRADSALLATAHPFHMDNVLKITFGWGGDTDGIDNSLHDAVSKFETESDWIRSLALEYALTNDLRYGDKAVALMRAWAGQQTIVNLYDFSIDFQNAWIIGETEGYNSDRPWNFALDAMWQTYGLINVSDAYLLLIKNNYPLAASDNILLRAWLLKLAEGVNSSFHAWTRWADAHPSSSSFERYRSDNHLSWCLAGLLGAAAALGDPALADYVIAGGAWYDSRAGLYTNPSPIKNVIDRAIESGTGNENEGRIYEEKILRNPPVGYSLFHLWAMMLVARTAAVYYDEELWNFRGQDNAGLQLAFERYAAFILGERASPEPTQEGNLTDSCWEYELAYMLWPTARFRQVTNATARVYFIIQSIGPVGLLLGE